MKNILFCIGVALAIFFPGSSFAQDAAPGPRFKTTQQDCTFHYSQVGYINPYFDDSIEDLPDDNSPERKRLTLTKSSGHNNSFTAHIDADSYFNNILISPYSFHPRTSLLVFISEWQV